MNQDGDFLLINSSVCNAPCKFEKVFTNFEISMLNIASAAG
jgi:hypothetical protein